MLPKFPYMAMSVTGVIHIILGLMVFMMICLGFNDCEEISKMLFILNFYRDSPDSPDVPRYILSDCDTAVSLYGSIIPSSIMMLAVGILGVLTGVKRKEHKTTHRLRLAYMITAIISAIIFSPAGIGLSVIASSMSFLSPGMLVLILCFADFIVSIVSSCYCCCCYGSATDSAGIVYVQSHPYANYYIGAYPLNHPPSNPAAVQNVSAPSQEHSSGSDYQQTPNQLSDCHQKNQTDAMMSVQAPPRYFPPGNYPVVNYVVGTYPPPNYTPGTYPPGTYPPALYPSNVQYARTPEGGVDNPCYQLNTDQSPLSPSNEAEA